MERVIIHLQRLICLLPPGAAKPWPRQWASAGAEPCFHHSLWPISDQASEPGSRNSTAITVTENADHAWTETPRKEGEEREREI